MNDTMTITTPIIEKMLQANETFGQIVGHQQPLMQARYNLAKMILNEQVTVKMLEQLEMKFNELPRTE